MAEIEKYIKNNSLKIIVKPNARKTEILSWDESKQALRIAIAAPAEKGKANVEVIKFFSRLTKKKVQIKSGLTSRAKLLKFS